MAIYLCHDEPDLYVHDAVVVDARPGAVALSRSAFHPGGGGQVGDIGAIEWTDGRLAVTHIEPDRDVWWHVLADPTAMLSGDVSVEVDAEHRLGVADSPAVACRGIRRTRTRGWHSGGRSTAFDG